MANYTVLLVAALIVISVPVVTLFILAPLVRASRANKVKLEPYVERHALTPHEEKVIATHEAGHAVVGLFCEHAPAIERISLGGDIGRAPGFVQHAGEVHDDREGASRCG